MSVLSAVYLAMAQGPQRTLYSALGDNERAQVAEALQTSGIDYSINNATGMITVSEDDYHRARMQVASDTGLAAPQGASDMLNSIPLGSSRTLEGERLKMARERELMLTIREIDGIESVRVHLATPERSAFVRDTSAPTASTSASASFARPLRYLRAWVCRPVSHLFPASYRGFNDTHTSFVVSDSLSCWSLCGHAAHHPAPPPNHPWRGVVGGRG